MLATLSGGSPPGDGPSNGYAAKASQKVEIPVAGLPSEPLIRDTTPTGRRPREQAASRPRDLSWSPRASRQTPCLSGEAGEIPPAGRPSERPRVAHAGNLGSFAGNGISTSVSGTDTQHRSAARSASRKNAAQYNLFSPSLPWSLQMDRKEAPAPAGTWRASTNSRALDIDMAPKKALGDCSPRQVCAAPVRHHADIDSKMRRGGGAYSPAAAEIAQLLSPREFSPEPQNPQRIRAAGAFSPSHTRASLHGASGECSPLHPPTSAIKSLLAPDLETFGAASRSCDGMTRQPVGAASRGDDTVATENHNDSAAHEGSKPRDVTPRRAVSEAGQDQDGNPRQSSAAGRGSMTFSQTREGFNFNGFAASSSLRAGSPSRGSGAYHQVRSASEKPVQRTRSPDESMKVNMNSDYVGMATAYDRQKQSPRWARTTASSRAKGKQT